MPASEGEHEDTGLSAALSLMPTQLTATPNKKVKLSPSPPRRGPGLESEDESDDSESDDQYHRNLGRPSIMGFADDDDETEDEDSDY
jgi:hypothetical protein